MKNKKVFILLILVILLTSCGNKPDNNVKETQEPEVTVTPAPKDPLIINKGKYVKADIDNSGVTRWFDKLTDDITCITMGINNERFGMDDFPYSKFYKTETTLSEADLEENKTVLIEKPEIMGIYIYDINKDEKRDFLVIYRTEQDKDKYGIDILDRENNKVYEFESEDINYTIDAENSNMMIGLSRIGNDKNIYNSINTIYFEDDTVKIYLGEVDDPIISNIIE